MHLTPQIDRRTFIADLGRGALALPVISVAGCGPSAASGSGFETLQTLLVGHGDPLEGGASAAVAELAAAG